MHLNSFLFSMAAPVAAKSVRAVAFVAQEVGQGFLGTLQQLTHGADEAFAADRSSGETASAPDQLQKFAQSFRRWLSDNGVRGTYELQFHVGQDGEPISSVVGKESEKISDLLHSNFGWLEQMAAITRTAGKENREELPTLPIQNASESTNPLWTQLDNYRTARPAKLSITQSSSHIL